MNEWVKSISHCSYSEVLRSNSNYHSNIDEPLSAKKNVSTKLFIERFQWMTVNYLIKKFQYKTRAFIIQLGFAQTLNNIEGSHFFLLYFCNNAPIYMNLRDKREKNKIVMNRISVKSMYRGSEVNFRKTRLNRMLALNIISVLFPISIFNSINRWNLNHIQILYEFAFILTHENNKCYNSFKVFNRIKSRILSI